MIGQRFSLRAVGFVPEILLHLQTVQASGTKTRSFLDPHTQQR